MKRCLTLLFLFAFAASLAIAAGPPGQPPFESAAGPVMDGQRFFESAAGPVMDGQRFFESTVTRDSKVSTRLQEALASRMPGERLKVWIYLVDKGPPARDGLAEALAAAEDRLTPRARRRLAMRTGGRAGWEDIQVYAPYVERIAASGGRIHHLSRWNNAVSVSGDPEEIRRIAELPFVRRIEAVDHLGRPRPVTPRRRSTPESTVRTRRTQTNRFDYGPSFIQSNQLQVPALHNIGLSGSGVLVALFDTGFNLDHPAFDSLSTRVEAERVFLEDHMGMPGLPNESHGTAVLSVIGGFAPGQLVGPAYGARYLLASTESVAFEEEIEEDWWIAAMEWADSLGVDVVSSSLGYLDWYTYEDMDGETALISRAASMAADRGIVVVNGMGNEGDFPYNKMIAPADAEKVISVGAVDADGHRVFLSSIGPTYDGRIKPDVMAMGAEVYTVDPSSPNDFTHSYGTSFSTPLVAGVAALLLEAYPHWTPEKVQRVLRQTASQAAHPDTLYGYGIVQAADALRTESRGTVRSFTAESGPSGVFLAWTTGLEINLASYRIDRRDYPDGVFELLDNVPVASSPDRLPGSNDYSYTDTSAQPGTSYVYRLQPVGRAGGMPAAEPVTVRVDHASGPAGGPAAVLYPNAPNPFNDATDIRFELTEPARVTLTIYDVLGRRVRVLADRMYGQGRYAVPWYGRDDEGQTAPSGVYFCRMTAGDVEEVDKMLLLR